MRLWFGVLAVGICIFAAGCSPSQSGNPGPTEEAIASPTASADASLPNIAPIRVETAPRQPAPTQPTSTLYVPPANATTIPRPFECEDHGYAGRADDDNSAVDTFWLTDPPEDPADAKFYVAQSICIAGMWIPPGNVQVWKADYTLRQLEDWHDELRRTADAVPASSAHMDTGINRLVFRTATARGEELFERLIVDSSMPREAVVVEVRDQMMIDDSPPNPSLEQGLELSIQFDKTAAPGQPITFSLVVENKSESTLPFADLGRMRVWGGSRWDVVIFTESGDQIWRLNFGYLAEEHRLEGEIPPAGSVEIEVAWDGLDDFRAPLEPALYWVRGFLSLSTFDSPYDDVMSTYPAPLQVSAS